MIDLIVAETNKYARKKLASQPQRLAKWQDATRAEMSAFFGISVIMGINSLPSLALYWSSNPFIGNVGIQAIMTKNRFEELCQYLHFNDSSLEPKGGEDNFDRLYKVRPVLAGILDRIKTVYEPSKCMSIDEGMRSEEHTSELQSRQYLVCRLLLEKKKKKQIPSQKTCKQLKE